MRALAVLLMLALSAPAFAQEKNKAEPKKAAKQSGKKAEKKAEKKAAAPSQDWSRFNQGSKKDLEQLEKKKN